LRVADAREVLRRRRGRDYLGRRIPPPDGSRAGGYLHDWEDHGRRPADEDDFHRRRHGGLGSAGLVSLARCVTGVGGEAVLHRAVELRLAGRRIASTHRRCACRRVSLGPGISRYSPRTRGFNDSFAAGEQIFMAASLGMGRGGPNAGRSPACAAAARLGPRPSADSPRPR
jgi:hypothetical protein